METLEVDHSKEVSQASEILSFPLKSKISVMAEVYMHKLKKITTE